MLVTYFKEKSSVQARKLSDMEDVNQELGYKARSEQLLRLEISQALSDAQTELATQDVCLVTTKKAHAEALENAQLNH